MAGGKLSARQKMINLMYLVFIAMMALQMSKKVLSAFGESAEEVVKSSEMKTQSNNYLIKTLEQSAKDQPQKYGAKHKVALILDKRSQEFADYMKALKEEVLKEDKAKIDPKTGKMDYEKLSKSAALDNMFFKSGKPTAKAKEFKSKIEAYKKYLLSLDDLSEATKENIKSRFNTADYKTKLKREGWLEHNFEGFPTIASTFKFDNYQAKARETENEIMSQMLRGQMSKDVSVTNYAPVVILDKSAYFPGERVTGKVALGRVDSTMTFKEVTINKTKVAEELLKGGQLRIDIPAGNVGEKEIPGRIVFEENNKPIPLDFSIKYAVIPIPNSAVISAEKMNVVYRGVKNPLAISIPGVSDNKVRVNAPGLSKVGTGKYVMDVTTFKGKSVKINVSGSVNGKPVSDSKVFRVKNIPAPTGTIRGESGMVKMPKRNLKISTVGASLPDFDFDIKLRVKAFDFKVPGQPTVTVHGNKLNAKAQKLLNRVKTGQTIQIYNIRTALVGNSAYKVKKPSIITVEISN